MISTSMSIQFYNSKDPSLTYSNTLFTFGNVQIIYEILLQQLLSPIDVVRPLIVGEFVSYRGSSLLLACYKQEIFNDINN